MSMRLGRTLAAGTFALAIAGVSGVAIGTATEPASEPTPGAGDHVAAMRDHMAAMPHDMGQHIEDMDRHMAEHWNSMGSMMGPGMMDPGASMGPGMMDPGASMGPERSPEAPPWTWGGAGHDLHHAARSPEPEE
jgi:hypothetical protein